MFLIKVCILLCIRPFSDVVLRDVCSQWRQQSQLLADSDFALVEPILAARSVAQQTLMSRVADPDGTLSSALTDHLMELCRLARRAGNTQVRRVLRLSPSQTRRCCTHGAVAPVQLAERAIFQMKLPGTGGSGASAPVAQWQLEEVQVFWAKGEQGLALGLLRQMTDNLKEKVRHNHT